MDTLYRRWLILRMIPRHSNSITVTGIVQRLTVMLRWWLRGFGPSVEVLEPKELRREFKDMAVSLTKIYR